MGGVCHGPIVFANVKLSDGHATHFNVALDCEMPSVHMRAFRGLTPPLVPTLPAPELASI